MADLRLLTVPRTQHVMSWAWRGASNCGGFSLGSSVGREGPLIEGPFIRWRGLRESLCGLRGGFWGEVGRKVAKPFRKILLVE